MNIKTLKFREDSRQHPSYVMPACSWRASLSPTKQELLGNEKWGVPICSQAHKQETPHDGHFQCAMVRTCGDESTRKIPVCAGLHLRGEKKLLAPSFNLGNKICITPSPCGFNRRTNATVKTAVWVRFIVSTG